MTQDYDTAAAVAIVGIGVRVPGASDADAYWDMIRHGREAIQWYERSALLEAGVAPALLDDPTYVPACGHLEDADAFDAAFFGITKSEAAMIDPQHRIFLETAYGALDHGGLVRPEILHRTGLFGGCFMNKYLPLNLYANRRFMASPLSTFARNYNDKDFLCGRVAHLLDLQGPVMTVQSACSTSLVAVHLACQSLLTYECDTALAGGAAVNLPYPGGYLAPEGTMFSPEGRCRTFDAQTTGTLPGNGAVVVALRRLEDALAEGDPIHAVILGSAVNNDGSDKASFTAPNVSAQRDVIIQAQQMAGIDVARVGYLEAHGTGTRLGDPIEVAALTEAFRTSTQAEGFCALGSIKANIGHLDAAAGTAGLARAALSLKQATIPPMANFRTPNPELGLAGSPFFIPDAERAWAPPGGTRLAGVSSFGVGGTNAHVVLAEPPVPQAETETRHGPCILPVSGKTAAAAERNAAALVDLLTRDDAPALADCAQTLTHRRPAFPYRTAVVADTPEEAADKLRALKPSAVDQAAGRDVVFLFPGVGTQYTDMAYGLYLSDDAFAEDIDRAAMLVKPHLGYDLREYLYPSDFPGPRHEPEAVPNVVCAVFAVSYALARHWMRLGLEPTALLGHSLGEYVAATVSGVLSLEDGLKITALRGKFFDAIPEGRMMVVPMPAKDLKTLLPEGVSLGAINAPTLSLVSGLQKDLVAFGDALLEQRQVECRILPVRMASHSHLVEAFLDEFQAMLGDVTFHAPQIPYLSCLTGDWITEAQATDPAYWAAQLRSPVQFADMVRHVTAPDKVLLEVGPGTTLSSLSRMQGGQIEHASLSSLRHPDEDIGDVERLGTTMGRLWSLGVDVALKTSGRTVPLPTYAFEKTKHWIAPDILIGPGAPMDGSAEIKRAPVAKDTLPSEASDLRRQWSRAQIQVAEVWEDILGVSVDALDADFNDLGGHSMLAAQVLAKLKTDLKISLDIADIYRAPTVAGLAELIDLRRAGGVDRRIDLRLEPQLAPDIRPAVDLLPVDTSRPVLLTGATGFLGAFLLDQLVRQTTGQIHLLVRGATSEAAFERVAKTAESYGLPVPPRDRLVLNLGDLSKPDLGLDRAAFDRLSETLGGILHCGAFVNFARPYEVLKPTNVTSLEPLLRLCGRHRLKPLHFVSTIFVNMGAITSGQSVVREDGSLSEPVGHDTGYTESKWVAEKVCEIARDRGFSVGIFRPGNILGARTNGAANLEDYLCRVIAGSVELGASPLRSYPLPFGAVDDVAETIVALSQSAAHHNGTYHVIQPSPLPWNDLLAQLPTAHLPIPQLKWDDWCTKLADGLSNGTAKGLSPLANMLDAPANREMPTFNIRNTTAARKALNLPFPQLDNAYLARMIRWVSEAQDLPARVPREAVDA